MRSGVDCLDIFFFISARPFLSYTTTRRNLSRSLSLPFLFFLVQLPSCISHDEFQRYTWGGVHWVFCRACVSGIAGSTYLPKLMDFRLYGVLSMQMYTYFQRYSLDRPFYKGMVSLYHWIKVLNSQCPPCQVVAVWLVVSKEDALSCHSSET